MVINHVEKKRRAVIVLWTDGWFSASSGSWKSL